MTYRQVGDKTDFQKRYHLKIIFCNVCGVQNKIPLIRHFLGIHKPDIFFLIETLLKPHNKINFRNPEYRLYRQDRPGDTGGGGIALLIKNGIKFKILQQNNSSIEHIAIPFDSKIKIVGAYNPPDNKLTLTDFHNLFNSHNKVLVVGDLNCRHPQWDQYANYPNANGNTLTKFCDYSECNIFHTTEPTHFPFQTNHTPSTIDLAIGKNINNLTKIKTLTDFNSDHDPILININIAHSIQNHNSPKIFNYNKTNWLKFRKFINENLIITDQIENIQH